MMKSRKQTITQSKIKAIKKVYQLTSLHKLVHYNLNKIDA